MAGKLTTQRRTGRRRHNRRSKRWRGGLPLPDFQNTEDEDLLLKGRRPVHLPRFGDGALATRDTVCHVLVRGQRKSIDRGQFHVQAVWSSRGVAREDGDGAPLATCFAEMQADATFHIFESYH